MIAVCATLTSAIGNCAPVLALRDTAGGFTTNPPPETIITPGQILIAIGTSEQLASLATVSSEADAQPPGRGAG